MLPRLIPACSLLLLILGACSLPLSPGAPDMPRPRLIILTDIGGDPDDRQSMIRLLHYANDFEIEALIASAAGTPGELDEAVVRPALIRELVDAYGEIRNNLALHAPGYPSADELRARIASGNPQRGRENVGDGHDTEGSRRIIEVVDAAGEGPVNIAIWGGQTDLAQALWRVRAERGAEGLRRFVNRVQIYDIADQDGIAEWMRGEFPGLFYVLSKAAEGADRREAAFRGMYLGGDESLTSRAWIDEHVRDGHGPLGALYPVETWTAPNPHGTMKEGDTPSWFYFLPVGLGDPAHPEWGGWGGRFEAAGGGLYRDAADAVGDSAHVRATVWRWREAFQRDFAARADWALMPYDGANHPPAVVVAGAQEQRVRPGDRVELDATASTDPDGDALSYRWWVYPEAGSFRGDVTIEQADEARAVVVAPQVSAPAAVHVILEVTDDGEPRLTRYARVVLRVGPGHPEGAPAGGD